MLSESFRWTIPETKSCNCNFPLRYEPQLGRNWPSKKQFCYKFSSNNFRKDHSFCHHSFVEVRQELNQIKNWTWLKRPEKDKILKGWVHFPFFLCLYFFNKSWKKVLKNLQFMKLQWNSVFHHARMIRKTTMWQIAHFSVIKCSTSSCTHTCSKLGIGIITF